MGVFFNMLYDAAGATASNPVPVSANLYDAGLKLQAINYSPNSWYFFRPYLTADFSSVVCDKTYFFLYSTDHDASTGGGIWWGKANNLDLSDFVEVGQVVSGGDQEETPFLMQIGSTLSLYYHTTTTEAGNGSKQQTRLITSVGGNQLHLNSWTDQGRPLGIVADENHTGYPLPYQRENDIILTHIGKGGLPQPWKTSVSTDGGLTYSRNETVDVITGIETGYFAQLSEGIYFTFQGQQFWIGQVHPETTTGGIHAIEKKIIIAKVTATEFSSVTQLDNIHPDLVLRTQAFIEGTTAHIYFTKLKSDLYYAKYDLNNLYQWL